MGCVCIVVVLLFMVVMFVLDVGDVVVVVVVDFDFVVGDGGVFVAMICWFCGLWLGVLRL